MSDLLHALFPTGNALEEIEMRWTAIAEQPFSELKKYVKALSPTPASVSSYLAAFPACRRGDTSKRTADSKGNPWFRRQAAQLEIAVAWCVAARSLKVKPLATMLANARNCCARFDELLVAERAASEARHAAQRKGGRNCQSLIEPARQLARALADLHRPPTGWRSPRAAAKAIEPLVRRFIVDEGLSIQQYDSLQRTISNWLRPYFADRAK